MEDKPISETEKLATSLNKGIWLFKSVFMMLIGAFIVYAIFGMDALKLLGALVFLICAYAFVAERLLHKK